MANSLLTPLKAAQGLALIVREQIRAMSAEGMNEKEIKAILDAVFSPLMSSPR